MSAPRHTMVDASGSLWTIPATAVRAVDAFNPDGPAGFQAVEPWVTDAPVRATRAEARRDIEAAKGLPQQECTCSPVENPWTYYGAVEPGGALEPNPDCPVHFPTGKGIA